jgi:glycosyltransferase involved in cell wall biosynthesis
MRVLKVIPGVSPDGGTEQSLVAMSDGLRARGVKLHLALLTSRQDLVPRLERQGVIVHDLSACHSVLTRARALRRVIAAISPDVIHASLYEATVPAQLASLRSGVPVLISWANVNYGGARLQQPGTSRFRLIRVQAVEALLGRLSASRYHAVTEAVAQLNRRHLAVPSGLVSVGERGRDPQRFPEAGPASTRDRVVLAVGRQDHQKGYESLLEAFDELADTDKEVRLQVAGRQGSATQRIRRVHESMRHGDRVDFLGQRDDVAELMAHAAAVVCASWREGAAGALIEAMASRTPIVSVPVAGLEGVLVPGENAVVVERRELARGLEQVLGDPDLADRLAEQGRRTFEKRFTIEAATDRMVEIYRQVALSD